MNKPALSILPFLLVLGCPEPEPMPDAFAGRDASTPDDVFNVDAGNDIADTSIHLDTRDPSDAFAPDTRDPSDAGLDARVETDAAVIAPSCPEMTPPIDSCVRRCELPLPSEFLFESIGSVAMHPTEQRVLLSVGSLHIAWLDLQTGAATRLPDASSESFGGRPIAVAPDGLSYLRSQDYRVERVNLADGVVTEVLHGGGTVVQMDFHPTGNRLVASGRAFDLPFPVGGYTYSTSGTAVFSGYASDQSLSPSGNFGTFRESLFTTPLPDFHVVNLLDRSDVAITALRTDHSAAMLSDTRLLVVGQDDRGGGYIDMVDVGGSRTHVTTGIFGTLNHVVARGGLVVIIRSGGSVDVYACDPS